MAGRYYRAPDPTSQVWAATKRHLAVDLRDFTAALQVKLLEGLDERFTDGVNSGILQEKRVTRDDFRTAVLATLSEHYPEPAPTPRPRRATSRPRVQGK